MAIDRKQSEAPVGRPLPADEGVLINFNSATARLVRIVDGIEGRLGLFAGGKKPEITFCIPAEPANGARVGNGAEQDKAVRIVTEVFNFSDETPVYEVGSYRFFYNPEQGTSRYQIEVRSSYDHPVVRPVYVRNKHRMVQVCKEMLGEV
jgi:hypothetical protein